MNTSLEIDYDQTLDLKFIERVGSPFDCDFPILGTGKMVKPVKDKKILVIRLEGCAELYALNNSVTYLTDNKEKYDKFLTTVNHEKFGSDDSAILFNDWKNIDKLFEENNMKFDVIIGNPPYNEPKPEGLRRMAPRLDTPIWKQACKYADNVVFVMGTINSRKKIGQTYQSEEFAFPGDVCVSVNIFAYKRGETAVHVKSRLEENGFRAWLKTHKAERSIRELLLPPLKVIDPRFYERSPIVPENEIWLHTRSGSDVNKNVFVPGDNYKYHTVERISCPNDKTEQLRQYIIDVLSPICNYACKQFGVDNQGLLYCVPLPDFMK